MCTQKSNLIILVKRNAWEWVRNFGLKNEAKSDREEGFDWLYEYIYEFEY